MRANLPTKIVLALVSFTLVVLIGLYASVNSIKVAMNNQSRGNSLTAVTHRMSTLHDKLSMMARDYNNWADVYVAIHHNDLDFVADNYGITAIYGDMFNAVSMFDGSLDSPIAWIERGDRKPRSSFLSEHEMVKIREQVKSLDTTKRETLDFFMKLDGELSFVSASYILPDTDALLKSVVKDDLSIAVLVRRLRDSEMLEMERALMIEDVKIADRLEPEEAVIPISGIDGGPIAFLSWIPSRGGDTLVETMLPVLIGIVLSFLVFAGAGITAVYRHAKDLELRERDATALARIDTLTGLPNRLAFNERLATVVSSSPGEFALMMIDLNGFKRINDMVGHQAGDQVIRLIGQFLGKLEGDGVFVARLGGDEFGVGVFDSVDVLGKLDIISIHITEELYRPISIKGHSFEMSAAQGAAVCDLHSLQAEEILRRADFAMYYAKRNKSRRIKIYSEAMEHNAQLDRKIEVGLRSGLDRPSEFHMRYQPIVAASDFRFVRAEALARWTPPFLGPIGPDNFIRVAEASELIIPLGWLLLKQVCRDMMVHPSLCVSVNISPIQLLDDGFIEGLLRLLALHGISTHRIEIELTESVMIMNSIVVAQRLGDLQRAGIDVALDDFGSGFSSFGSLRALPFDTLKIDKTLVACATESVKDGALVHSVVMLGRSMGKKIVGEGVETESDARYLLQSGCEFLQGYLFGMPMPIDELGRRFLEAERVLA